MTEAVFTKGSTLRHILVMTGASTIGLATMFTVDLVDIYFLSLLGDEKIPAAVGFAGTPGRVVYFILLHFLKRGQDRKEFGVCLNGCG